MPSAVSIEGPYSRQSQHPWEGDEVPYWSVALVDDWGEIVGKPYDCATRRHALSLARKMASDRRLPLIDDSGPA